MAASIARKLEMEADGKVNILLVDDQPGKLLSYQAILADLGENLIPATSGREALEHLLKSDFALILVDVCMPEQDGFELVETIRAHHRFSQTAIIFVSAIQMDDMDRIRGYASGAVDYVSVPIVPEILRAKVSVFVDLYRKSRQLEQLNLELEERVSERTAKLIATQEALREADQRKNEFLATLAHELRNPLAPMRSALDLFKVSDESQAALASEVIDRQVNQLARLVDDLMDLSRITRNRIELRRAPTDLEEVVKGALEVAQVAIRENGQTLIVDLPAEPIVVDVDGARISQVIANLLNNASKYTPSGGKIDFSVTAEGQDLTIRVCDNGLGIAAEDLPRICEPFYQTGRSKDRPNSGLGIGLTLVNSIVEEHGGTVSISSDGMGQGSEFTVNLPGVTRAAEPAQTTTESTDSPNLPRRRVLLADDNVDAARIMGLILEYFGNDVAVANDGIQAAQMADEIRPELILLDIGMPGMSGCDVARHIRSQPWGATPVIVAITGWGQAEDRQETADAGFDRHLVKPVEMSTIQALLNDLDAARR